MIVDLLDCYIGIFELKVATEAKATETKRDGVSRAKFQLSPIAYFQAFSMNEFVVCGNLSSSWLPPNCLF